MVMNKRSIVLALLMGLLVAPAFAQDTEKKDGKKKADAAKKQDGKKKKEMTEAQKAKRAEQRKKKAAAARKKRSQPSYVMNMLKAVDLTKEQTVSVKKVASTYDPKFVALREKQQAILTAEQKKAIQEARTKNREARKASDAAKKKTGDSKKADSAKQTDGEKKKSDPGRKTDGAKKSDGQKRRGGQMGGITLSKDQQKQRQEIAKAQRELRNEVVGKLKSVLTEEQAALLPGTRQRKATPKKKKKADGESKKKKKDGEKKDK